MPTFIELAPFAAAHERYRDDEELAELQWHLIADPEAGDLSPRSGGCRKLRWRLEGRGKRGGARVIYFNRTSAGAIVLVTMHVKNVKDNVDPGLLKEHFEHG